MPDRQITHIVVQNSSLVVCASHEYLGLFLIDDDEALVVDAFEGALNDCIAFLSSSRTHLYKSMFFTLILSLLITTLRSTPVAV